MHPDTETAVEVNKILISLSSTATNQTPKKVDDNQRQSDLQNTLELFKLDTGRYPSTEDGLKALMVKIDGYDNWMGPYLRPGNENELFEKFEYKTDSSGGYTLSPKAH